MDMGTVMGTVTGIEVATDRRHSAEHNALARRRLWQLISPTLPVGAYSYSAGLEYAIDAAWIADVDQVQDWIRSQVVEMHARVDVPALIRLHAAWSRGDRESLARWNTWLRVNRETSELRAEDTGQGRALARLLTDLGIVDAAEWAGRDDVCWATPFALAVWHWGIPLREALEGYLWVWCENQVAAAVKLVPLGQTQGQRLLLELAGSIGSAVDHAEGLEDADLGGGLPGVILASALHETQYSRLFRS